MKRKYALRKAAGCFWLICVNQQGPEYIAPIALNECGAQIWESRSKGCTTDEIAAELSEIYAISVAEAREDIVQFDKVMKEHGI